jgi:hypothetical protein
MNEDISLPLPREFLGKKYLLRVFYDDKREQFSCHSLEPRELSSLVVPSKGIQRAVVYAYFDPANVTRGRAKGESQPY